MITTHKTPHAAKLAAPHAAHQPALILRYDGTFDTIPFGQPIPRGSVIIARLDERGWHDVAAR